MTPHDEVKRLHVAVARWLRGEVDKTPAAFDEIGEMLHDEFEMISPHGVIDNRASFLAEFHEQHGAWRESGFGIEIRELTSRWASRGFQLVRYEEWHTGKQPVEVRLASALFECDQRGHWYWRHLHETWKPQT